jgi:hypothetical protein
MSTWFQIAITVLLTVIALELYCLTEYGIAELIKIANAANRIVQTHTKP